MCIWPDILLHCWPKAWKRTISRTSLWLVPCPTEGVSSSTGRFTKPASTQLTLSFTTALLSSVVHSEFFPTSLLLFSQIYRKRLSFFSVQPRGARACTFLSVVVCFFPPFLLFSFCTNQLVHFCESLRASHSSLQHGFNLDCGLRCELLRLVCLGGAAQRLLEQHQPKVNISSYFIPQIRCMLKSEDNEKFSSLIVG